MEPSFFDSNIFSYLLMPFLIFLARICDVSIGTMRIIFVAKGKKNIAPFLGFFEVLIWIIAISKIMQNLDNYVNYFAYAAGFATGNYVGMIIEEKLAMGVQMIRVFAHNDFTDLVKSLNENGHGVTVVEAQGARKKVHLIYIVAQRNDLEDILAIIKNFNPKSFYTIEDLKMANEGIFPPIQTTHYFCFQPYFKQMEKGEMRCEA